MLDWIKTNIQNLRIFLDYPAYEKKCRYRYLALAESRYSICDLETNIAGLNEKIRKRADSKFDQKIIWFNTKIRPYANEIEKNNRILRLFQTDYKEKLDRHYSQKKHLINDKMGLIGSIKHLRSELNHAYTEKSSAYGQLADAKSDVEDWYSQSEGSTWFGGNKGRNIPNHSFFGQSYGDLNSAKNDRGNAVDNISQSKAKIARLKEEVSKVQATIESMDTRIKKVENEIILIKENRNEMFRLKKEGISKQKLKAAIARDKSRRDQYQSELNKIRTAKESFIQTAKIKSGVIDMMSRVDIICDKKKTFIAEFESEVSRLARKQDHRVQWFEQRK